MKEQQLKDSVKLIERPVDEVNAEVWFNINHDEKGFEQLSGEECLRQFFPNSVL